MSKEAKNALRWFVLGAAATLAIVIGASWYLRSAYSMGCGVVRATSPLKVSATGSSRLVVQDPSIVSEQGVLLPFDASEFGVTFSYFNKQGAVWVDERPADDDIVDTFIYRFPVDPSPGQDPAGNDAYYKTASGASHLSLVVRRGRKNESAREYLDRVYPGFIIGTSSTPRPDLASSLFVSYPPSHGSNGGELFVWSSGTLVFELANESQMFTSAEFHEMIDSIVQVSTKDR